MTKPTSWVKESLFGIWFLSTEIWLDKVIDTALNDLETLFPDKLDSYPKILDIGCGRGSAFKQLDQRFVPELLAAIEVDETLLQKAAKQALPCRSSVSITTGNAETLPYPDNSFDMVFCHQSFHHIIEHNLAMQEFYRVLKPGGVLLFAESCRKFIHSLTIRLLFRHPMEVQKTADEYLSLIEKTGFSVNPTSISKPYLWWSRWDLGAFEWLGLPLPKNREETLLNLVATKPNFS